MGLVDGTRELMRHDLEAWPVDRLAGRSGQAGMTRRGLSSAGLVAAVLVAGGLARRARRAGTGSASPGRGRRARSGETCVTA